MRSGSPTTRRWRPYAGRWGSEPAAQALIGGYLPAGDVVLPQLIANPREVDSFASVATPAGASFVHLVLRDPSGAPADRFRRRAGNDPWHAEVRRLVAEAGGARRPWSRYAPSLALGGYSTTDLPSVVEWPGEVLLLR